jgi:uncharacterized protein (TIGR03435 family)
MRRRWIAVALALTVVALDAQTSKPTFEVASVKKRAAPPVLSTFANPNVTRGATFSMPSATVASLIEFAYSVRDTRIVDAPGWIRTDLFEVQGRAATEQSTEQLRLMVQSLLEERFKLVARREAREMSHFSLLLVRSDGRLGPTLQQRDCRDPATRPKRPDAPNGASQLGGCGTISTLAETASRWMRLPVIDRTGLEGTFDYFLFASSEDAPQVNIPGAPIFIRPPADPSLPSFRDALRNQLGLKLESVRGPVDVIVIDSVQQPTEN